MNWHAACMFVDWFGNLRQKDRRPFDIVERDGDAMLRNDGCVLRPLDKDPYYILATVYGEAGDWIDSHVHRRNRRIWNGWMCQWMSDAKKSEIAQHLGVDVEELAPLAEDEKALLTKALIERMGSAEVNPPDPFRYPDWSNSYVEGSLSCSGFYFRYLGLKDCYVAHQASFERAYFEYELRADRTHFEREAVFAQCHFGGTADFGVSFFASTALFCGSRFKGNAFFSRALFVVNCDLSDCIFEYSVNLTEVTFFSRAPALFGTKLHPDTSMTTDLEFWPKVGGEDALSEKRAYTRLRQIMNEAHKPDEECFFFRQEMRCKAVSESWPDSMVITVFGALSDFGFSVVRPMLALGLAWLVPGFFYLVAYASDIIGGASDMSVFGPFGLSFSNLFAFFGLADRFFLDELRSFGPWLSLMAGAQTVVGFVLLFLLGLGLRNRFRMR